ncbi:hypothetical protein [Butyrivibrio fibrisolvens]|uniref:hypothetical protein n=1 Tax=Butyrivibrio fibrisolvens TaxID=831 RepID=UPI0003FBA41B|nr:hypothetical protein [Butyrivibrio fibrisolvens]
MNGNPRPYAKQIIDVVKEYSMLQTLEDMKLLSKYLITDNAKKRTRKLFIDVSSIPSEDKEKLLEYDDAFYLIKGYHMITNYEVLS